MTIRLDRETAIYTGNFQKNDPYTNILTQNKGRLQFYTTDGKGNVAPLGSGADIPVDSSVLLGHLPVVISMTISWHAITMMGGG